MIKILYIAFGGGVGASLRYLLNESLKNHTFFSLPLGIMVVNFLGCFCIGIAMTQLSELKDNLYLFLVVGFLGSFTTMSAFSQQTIEMLYNGRDINALVYVLASIGSCILGTYIAYALFKTS
ncbi:fluoride efflux transporter CrcB [Gammaproteobacteria bacterium]|nr:fluoride efflux transporter CrcB [Gammaproteobacteria bacterium]MDB9947244.1 fluoride efflux transporter CrcB [Gammaproteobacteria bacterium]